MAAPRLTRSDSDSPADTDPDSLRLFFALWPDEATRSALDRNGKSLHQHWGGRRMRADGLHMTLAFLGRTPVAQLDALFAHVDPIRARAFRLTLDQPGHWRHNRIGWLGPSQPPVSLGDLVKQLNGAVKAAGVDFDARPHVPHVTLLRNTAGGDAPVCEPVDWNVREFVLVSSHTEMVGARYEVVRQWALS